MSRWHALFDRLRARLRQSREVRHLMRDRRRAADDEVRRAGIGGNGPVDWPGG